MLSGDFGIEEPVEDVRGVITKGIDNIPEAYNYLTKKLDKDILREYLEALGIFEERLGNINKSNMPINLEEYIEQ